MTRCTNRAFPIFDLLGGREVIADAMTKAGFSENADRLLRGYLDRQQISGAGMRFLMAMADEKGVAYQTSDFHYSDGNVTDEAA